MPLRMRPRSSIRSDPTWRLAILGAIALAMAWGNPAAQATPAPGEPPRVMRLPGAAGESADASLGALTPVVTRLTSADEDLCLEIVLPALVVESFARSGEVYHRVEIPGGGIAGAPGEPMRPTIGQLICVPDSAGVELELLSVETVELQGYRLWPLQAEDDGEFLIHRAAYAREGFAERLRLRAGEPAIARDRRVLPIQFEPLRYDPSRDVLEVTTRAVVAVRFADRDLRNAAPRRRLDWPAAFEPLRGTLLLGGADAGERATLGGYLLICPDDPDVVSALQPLVTWRTRQGFGVRLATTAETGSSRESIKGWIQNAFDTWQEPPAYITLVGDVTGPITLPTWFESWSGYGGEGDHPYVELAGDDVLADAHIGRISVGSLEHLQLYVAKIVGYESTPYVAETDWYRRGCLVGDPSISGYTCVQVMQWLKERLLQHGYAEVDTVFTAPWVAQMMAAVNRGNSVFGYRGFYGMSGFGVGEIMALQNGWKMPFAVNLTCLTGDFASSTSRSEAWIRSGIPPSVPNGGIASIGTATGGTHTRYNNCVTYGIWRAPFWEESYRFGAALTRGEYELFVNYWANEPNTVRVFSHWNNLMGDAAGELWTDVPQPLEVAHPAEIGVGANAVVLTVASQGQPCAQARVCLWWDGVFQSVATTDASGFVELPVETPQAGQIAVTVTKHNHAPYLGELAVRSPESLLTYSAHTVDDDGAGTSQGNGDGLLNPGETIELAVQIRNAGELETMGVTGRITSDDPYLVVTDDEEEFGDLLPGESVWCADDFDLQITGGAPHGHRVVLGLDLDGGWDSWRARIELEVVAAAFEYEHTTLDGFGSRIDPGESGEISLQIRNAGGAVAADVAGTLLSQSPWVTVTDESGQFGSIGVGQSGENDADPFGLDVAADAFPGHRAEMVLLLVFSGGARDTVTFALTVGESASSDPTGPDGYGYYAFDNTDDGYDAAPVYDWIEIDPNHGGLGTSVGLSDFGQEQDDSRTIALPFPFTYYGVTHQEATICSNGWLAMGRTYLTNYRNWNIPAGGAPANMIAPMWDNLYQSGTDQVYHWHDAENQRYIVQWSRLRNMAGGHRENFEVILYDEAHHPTDTGDGRIVFQYETFNNSDSGQHYSTIGMQNETRSDGLLYGYFNDYAAGAAAVASGRAISLVAAADSARGLLAGSVTNATNGETPLGGATISVAEAELILTSGGDGSYGGSVPSGSFTLIVTHPSFAADTAYNVTILAGGTTIRDFVLEDVAGPQFSGTTELPSTSDTAGPYVVTTSVTDESQLDALELRYRVVGGDWSAQALEPLGGDLYAAEIPGQPLGSLVLYYLWAEDVGSNTGVDPPGAPDDVYWFWVHDPQFADDMEEGAGSWTHEVVTGGYLDQWHLSSRRNHTPGGEWSWKFGATGSGGYARLGDGALLTDSFSLSGTATLRFWHWIDSEIFWHGDEYAFDGGRLEIAIDGGPWAPIAPTGGYPYRLMDWQGGSPFPSGTWLYAGQQDWSPAEFILDGIEGNAQVRFRFGSDDLVVAEHEGWYIDDVELLLPGAHPSALERLDLRPEIAVLQTPAPNPLAGRAARAQIRFALPRATEVTLRVADVSGRSIRTLLAGDLPPGVHTHTWDARGRDGQLLPSGVYYCVLELAGVRLSRRVTIVR